MPNQDEWFDELYKENGSRMIKLATYLLRNEQVAADLVDEAFLILLYKRDKLANHPNLPGWLSQTLKNLISDELKSAKHQLELPLNENTKDSTDQAANMLHLVQLYLISMMIQLERIIHIQQCMLHLNPVQAVNGLTSEPIGLIHMQRLMQPVVFPQMSHLEGKEEQQVL